MWKRCLALLSLTFLTGMVLAACSMPDLRSLPTRPIAERETGATEPVVLTGAVSGSRTLEVKPTEVPTETVGAAAPTLTIGFVVVTETTTATPAATLVVEIPPPTETPAAEAPQTDEREATKITGEIKQTPQFTRTVLPIPTLFFPLETPEPPQPPEPFVPEPAESVGAAVLWIDDVTWGRYSRLKYWRDGATQPLNVDGADYTTRVQDLAVSPDGQWIVFARENHPSLWKMNLATGELTEIEPSQPGWELRDPAWSPDGATLAFVAEVRPAPWAVPSDAGIWTSTDGQDRKQVVAGLGWPGGRTTLFGWHPNGQDLVYGVIGVPGSPHTQWFTVPASGEGSPTPLPFSGELYDLAPDGSWLLGEGFTRSPGNKPREHSSFRILMRVPIGEEAAPQVLTPACASDFTGRISPDGTRIAFLSLATIGPACPPPSGAVLPELWVMNSDGTGRTRLESRGPIGPDSPQWSADGSYLYFSGWENGARRLWRVDAAGAAPPEELPETEGVDRFVVIR